MTFLQLYNKIKSEYDKSAPRIKEYFSLQTLLNELYVKYGLQKAQHILSPDKEVENHKVITDDALRALGGYPLLYVMGRTEFWNCEFYVGEGVLIPRSDTEISVEKAIERLKDGDVVYDLCCGSGCIGISLLKNSRISCCYCADISSVALEYTKKNGILNGVSDRLEVMECDVTKKDCFSGIPPADLIISNPPYLTTDEMKHIPGNVRYEPEIALDGGDDGCDFYRRIIDNFTPKLKDGGYMIFEIAPTQSEILKALFTSHGYTAQVYPDYRGNLRTVCGKKKKTIEI